MSDFFGLNNPPPTRSSFVPTLCGSGGFSWREVRDGNPEAFALFRRHYSYRISRSQQKFWPNASDALFVGPGEKMVLLSSCGHALFVWRKFRSADGQQGVNCSVFRNEGGAVLSSQMIRAAMVLAWSAFGPESGCTLT